MKSKVIYEDNDHKWVVMGRDKGKGENIIDTNEYVIINNGKCIILDPGGIDIFPHMLSELIKYVKTSDIVALFSSHQDPDIISSLPMWLDLNPNIKTYCSWLWTGFISHFSMGYSDCLVGIPDKGTKIRITDDSHELVVVPAHYCHSSGNFSLYDPKSRILFSGDVGAGLLPEPDAGLFVEDFNEHIQYMHQFHTRWMPSSEALRDYVKRVRKLDPVMICPQHGAIFDGENVAKLLDWLASIEVGKCG